MPAFSAISQLRLSFVGLRNLKVPKEGPKSIPVQLQFNTLATTDLDLDLLSQEQLNKFSMVQGLYVDNGRNGSTLTITIGVSQQRIDIPPNNQAYLPVLCPNPIKIHFNSAGNIDDCFCHLLNFPVTALMWHV